MTTEDDLPAGCECDNTHEANSTVCRWCYAHGRRRWSDPEVQENIMFKFIVTIEYTDGSSDKSKELFSLPAATKWAQDTWNAARGTKTVKEIVIHSRPWL